MNLFSLNNRYNLSRNVSKISLTVRHCLIMTQIVVIIRKLQKSEELYLPGCDAVQSGSPTCRGALLPLFAAEVLLVVCLAYSLVLKMEAACSSVTSVYLYRTTWRTSQMIVFSIFTSVNTSNPACYVRMYVCMYKGGPKTGPSTATFNDLLCFPF
jgi:hypothetical protein